MYAIAIWYDIWDSAAFIYEQSLYRFEHFFFQHISTSRNIFFSIWQKVGKSSKNIRLYQFFFSLLFSLSNRSCFESVVTYESHTACVCVRFCQFCLGPFHSYRWIFSVHVSSGLSTERMKESKKSRLLERQLPVGTETLKCTVNVQPKSRCVFVYICLLPRLCASGFLCNNYTRIFCFSIVTCLQFECRWIFLIAAYKLITFSFFSSAV